MSHLGRNVQKLLLNLFTADQDTDAMNEIFCHYVSKLLTELRSDGVTHMIHLG